MARWEYKLVELSERTDSSFAENAVQEPCHIEQEEFLEQALASSSPFPARTMTGRPAVATSPAKNRLSDTPSARAILSRVYSVGALASAGMQVLVGWGIDRIGNRIIMADAAVLFSGALFLLSTVSGVVTLLFGFALLCTFRCGVLTLAARILVPHWFHTRAGRTFSLISLAVTNAARDTLTHSICRLGEIWQPIREDIGLEVMRCRYGGGRLWM